MRIKAQNGLALNVNPFEDETYGNLDNIQPQFNPNYGILKPPVEDAPTMGESAVSSFSALPGMGKTISGVYNLVQSIRERRKQKEYKKISKMDADRRRQTSKQEDFYYTPYQLGGPVDSSELNQFYNFYNKAEQQTKQNQYLINQYYQDTNQDLKNQWKQSQNNAISDYVGSIVEGVETASKLLLQEGGQVTDIYSPDFNLKSTRSKESNSSNNSENNLQDNSWNEDEDVDDLLYGLLMEDIQRLEIQDDELDIMEQDIEMGNYGESLPITPYIVDMQKKFGVQPGSINTGEHNEGSRHMTGHAFDIPGSKHGGKEGLRQLLPILQESYPDLELIDEIDAPAGKVGTGNHIHVQMKR